MANTVAPNRGFASIDSFIDVDSIVSGKKPRQLLKRIRRFESTHGKVALPIPVNATGRFGSVAISNIV